MSSPIQITQQLWSAVVSNVTAEMPREGCGLLGGKDGIVAGHYPVENEARSTNRFRMQPQQQLQAFLWMDEQQQDLVAIYHSHPAGAAYPSETDLMEHAYPGVVNIILAPSGDGWQGAAFLLDDGNVQPVELWVNHA